MDVLVNVGVYREGGLGEPALAALIQEDIAANPGQPPVGGHGTFSFDLDNGGCGVLTAVHLLRGFLESGAVRLGLVVASDSPPGPLSRRRLPYAESGGALLLRWDEGTPGFGAVRLATFPEFDSLSEGYWTWRPHRPYRPGGPAGSKALVVVERPGFLARAVECAESVAGDLLAEAGLDPAGVDLLVATGGPGFADALADRLGISHERTVHVGEEFEGSHTAEPVAAVAAAMRSGGWQSAQRVLFVSAGSGITVAAGLYRQ